MIKKYKEYYALGISMIIIAFVTGIPLFARGIGGDVWDMTYHLLRIESVKEALVNGSFPPRVNPIFFNGYGYGSSIFYPDIFLVIPAFMNICGVSLLLSCKIFILFIAMLGVCTTFFAIRFVCRDWRYALSGSYVLMLSTFYLADINNRAGLSEYMACVFIPVLIAGIYDYFEREGLRTYLIGIAFAGMVLCHTIMTYIGVLVTVAIFVIMLIIPAKRKLVFEKRRFKRLLLTAVLTVLSVSYYIFPMLEQMLNDRFRFGEPWAKIGDYPQTIKSFFKPVGVFLYNADFGVGIPVLILLAGRVFLGRLKNKWADFFAALGVLLLLVMTDIVPWKYLENTQLNMIQFTYRFYPYALFFIICGMAAAYAEKKKGGWINRCFLAFIVTVTIVCGIWQNIYCYNFGTRVAANMEYLYQNSHYVGKGEWVPEGVTDAVFNGEGNDMVVAGGTNLQWTTRKYNHYAFSVKENNGKTYTAPLLYYKGYRAKLTLPNGKTQELPVSKSEEGLVKLELQQEMNGVIEVWYAGTAIQKLSNVMSCVVILGIVIAFALKYKKLKIEK